MEINETVEVIVVDRATRRPIIDIDPAHITRFNLTVRGQADPHELSLGNLILSCRLYEAAGGQPVMVVWSDETAYAVEAVCVVCHDVYPVAWLVPTAVGTMCNECAARTDQPPVTSVE